MIGGIKLSLLQETSTRALPKKPNPLQRLFGDGGFKYWSLVPMLIVLIILTVYPMIQLLRMSVSEVSWVEGQQVWNYVGLEYFNTVRADPVVGIAIRNTLYFVVVTVVLETFLGLILALAVSQTKLFSTLYRSVIIIPLLIPAVAIGTMWSLMYDYNYGALSQFFYAIGVKNPPLWTADPSTALFSVILVDVWHWTSFLFLIILAGVQSLPEESIEAAKVDGANAWQQLRYVMLPLLVPTIIIAAMLRTIHAFKVFDQIFVLTSGGPGTSTQVISLYIYEVFNDQARIGYASFLALGVTLIMCVFVLFYLWLNRSFGRRFN